jgi:type IV secretory pathway component VirB8
VFWFSYSTVTPIANNTSAHNERNSAIFAAVPAGAIIITLAIVTTLVIVLKMKSKSHFPTPHLETR